MPQRHWYLLQTKPNQEARALTNLEQQGYPVFCPMLSVEKLRRGKVTMALEAMFARYLFIQLDSSRSGLGWSSIRSTLGVSHLVSFGGVPAKVDAALIAHLQQHAQQAAPEHLFHAEERLLIADGPFAGLEAIYQATNGEGRAMVLITLLGQSTRLQVQAASLSKLS
jgi:transcriptional antiterminator RfaH